MKNRKRQGFTLVEIAITVSIIGLLAGIGIPAFTGARTRSLETQRKSNVRLLNNAVEMWAMDEFVSDNAPIGMGITNYIKGGFSALKIGSTPVNVTNIVNQVASHEFVVDDLY